MILDQEGMVCWDFIAESMYEYECFIYWMTEVLSMFTMHQTTLVKFMSWQLFGDSKQSIQHDEKNIKYIGKFFPWKIKLWIWIL